MSKCEFKLPFNIYLGEKKLYISRCMNLVYKTVFRKIIVNPKKAFSTIDSYQLFEYKIHLFILAGINNALVRKWLEVADVSNNLFIELAKYIAIGAFAGWLPMLFVSWLLFLSGKWLKGGTEFMTIANLMGYAFFYPVILSLISTITSIIFLRLNGFVKNNYFNNIDIKLHNTFYLIIQLHRYLNWGFNFYYVVLMIIGISVVQGFTILKSVLNVFVAILIITIPLGVIVLIPSLFGH